MEPGPKLAYAIETAHGWCIGEYAHSVSRFRPGSGAGVLPINTGRCICTHSGPFNFAVGLAIGKPITALELSEVEDFFRSRGLQPRIDVTPYSDPTLINLLRERGYVPCEFTNTLYFDLSKKVPCVSPVEGIVVRWAESSECDVWVNTIMKCFFLVDPGKERRANMACLFRCSKTTNAIAKVEGEVAGVAGGMLPDDGCTSTIYASAVLPPFRNRGIHNAMLRLRLERARDAGCKMVVVSATPGSVSEHNLIHYGFTPCYEKITYTVAQ